MVSIRSIIQTHHQFTKQIPLKTPLTFQCISQQFNKLNFNFSVFKMKKGKLIEKALKS